MISHDSSVVHLQVVISVKFDYMFTTLNANSFKQILASPANNQYGLNISTITGKPKRTRSKNGCFCCRMRKKKCDENRPACGLCVARKTKCVYEGRERRRNPEIPETLEPKIVSPGLDELLSLSPVDRAQATEIKLEEPKLIEVDDDGEPLDTLDHMNSPVQLDTLDFYGKLEYSHKLEQYMNIASLLPKISVEPTSPFQLLLDEKGMRLLHYFQNEVVKTICILPQAHQNHFYSTYMSVAVHDEGMMNLLAAWGALFLEGPNSDNFRYRITKADQVARRTYSGKVLGDRDKFNMMCYYLNLAGLGVCSGDTSDWYELLQNCVSKLKEFGTIADFLKRFNHLNEARWIVSNIQYHDVMSSVSLKYGTMIGMDEYSLLFEDENDFSYGVDPLQGCIHPVFLLLGEIMNVNSSLRRSRQKIEEALETLQYDPQAGGNLHQLQGERMQHYIRASKEGSRLMTNINECEPKSNQQCFLDHSDLENHLTLFEAFRNTCKLYVLLYIQETQPRASEVQLILLDTFKLIDLLINCNLRPAIGMVMLICGICCCYPVDRLEMQRKFAKLHASYKVVNLDKVRHIVEQSWVANPDGNINIDWPDLCEKIGWKLSAS